jgi:predicted dehydrogenase
MTFPTSRRTFLKVGGGALAAWMSPTGAQAAEAGNRKRVGLIGCGWYGKSDTYRLLQVAPVEVVAICDVDQRMREEAAGLIAARQASSRAPRQHKDFREMLREKDLDLVIVGTPDHWHALPTLAAMEAGAHVYLQKPVGVDVMEGRAILETARRLGKVVQIGTQRRSTAHLIQAKQEIIDAGKLGTVGHIEMCSYYHMRVNRPAVRESPPEWLDWDFWCGPAPLVDYHPAIHPGGWRSFR